MLINASSWFLTVESDCSEGFTGNDATCDQSGLSGLIKSLTAVELEKLSFIVKDEAESDCVDLKT